MDINLTLLNGRLATPPMIETAPDGATRARMLVLVRTSRRRRIDVVPVIMTDPPSELTDSSLGAGKRIYVAGSLIRRCAADPFFTMGRLEVSAESISLDDHAGSETRR